MPYRLPEPVEFTHEFFGPTKAEPIPPLIAALSILDRGAHMTRYFAGQPALAGEAAQLRAQAEAYTAVLPESPGEMARLRPELYVPYLREIAGNCLDVFFPAAKDNWSAYAGFARYSAFFADWISERGQDSIALMTDFEGWIRSGRDPTRDDATRARRAARKEAAAARKQPIEWLARDGTPQAPEARPKRQPKKKRKSRAVNYTGLPRSKPWYPGLFAPLFSWTDRLPGWAKLVLFVALMFVLQPIVELTFVVLRAVLD